MVNKEAVHGFQRIATRLPTTWLVLLTMIGYPKKRRRKKSKQTSKLTNIQTKKQNQKKAKKGVYQSRIVSVTKGWTGKTMTKFGKVKGENRKAQDRIVFTTLFVLSFIWPTDCTASRLLFNWKLNGGEFSTALSSSRRHKLAFFTLDMFWLSSMIFVTDNNRFEIITAKIEWEKKIDVNTCNGFHFPGLWAVTFTQFIPCRHS